MLAKSRKKIFLFLQVKSPKSIFFPSEVTSAGSSCHTPRHSWLPAQLCQTTTSSSSSCGIFGPVPTSCKNLHPENKQLGNASSCIPGLGPRRQRAPITQQLPRAGRDRGEPRGMWDAEPSRENSILLPAPALCNQRTSAQTKAACAGAAPHRCHSPCLLQDFRALLDAPGGVDLSVPSRLTCSMGGTPRTYISAFYFRISYTFGLKNL